MMAPLFELRAYSSLRRHESSQPHSSASDASPFHGGCVEERALHHRRAEVRVVHGADEYAYAHLALPPSQLAAARRALLPTARCAVGVCVRSLPVRDRPARGGEAGGGEPRAEVVVGGLQLPRVKVGLKKEKARRG